MNSRYNEEVQKLFEFWCEIRPATAGEKASGYIISSFPEKFKDPEIITKIPDFAYPCNFTNDSLQLYSFVLTSSDSKWRFGFCRHDPRSGTAMVLITYLPWHDTFIRFMNVLGELKKSDGDEFQPFLSEAYNRGVPEPGASLKLFYNSGTNNFMFQRPSQFQLPSIPENHNLNLYYNFVDARNMISVFAAMLAERRIVFTSHRFDRLSSCVQAANAFLYPMVWQHIFIPILPMKMREILCAPMPFLIGVPEAVLKTMTRDELGEVVVLNCDNKTFDSPFDDVKSMPQELVSQLKKQLSNPSEHIGDRVSKIFLGILVQLIGGYRDAIKFTQGDKITWDRDTFIDSRAPSLRPFLRNMMELQIFQQFIEERLDMLNTGLGFSDEFELETLRHSEKTGRKGMHYKGFLKNVKDKVKQGSRGVKSAYKDFKSKLRDRTPPNSSHQYGNHSQSHDGGHHSAPNSPVFTKRPQTEYSHNQNHRKPNTMLQTSNSLMNNSNFTNNNHINKSPTVSQPSSNSSSEMNILQELQQHALFKMPAVDRSLKPSMDYSTLRPLRSGSLLHTPTFQSTSDSYSSDALSIGALCLVEATLKSSSKHRIPNPSDDSFNSSSKSSSFDSPPEMPSPPVPPRVSNSNHAKTKIDLPVSMFENQFVNNDFYSINTSVAAPPIAPIRKSHIEQNKSNDTTPNLINLEANTSFELEDFDPLNKNAKPMPPPKTALVASSSQSLNRVPLPGLANPMYPYYTPQRQMPLKKPQNRTNDDDVELLRKYGLDQFSLVDDCNMGASGSSQSNGSMRNSSDRNNWTVFD
ncbi:DENN domain-containing protein 1B isoform X2 [Bradysia coprophila]|uniref:DENN domain-containing protein 1B isoform X2 n=1 Tax=Bradysia coprophila TaxID=38358 RepID=UPI00187DB44F|nr:DENN domain-containing protein 1B isoform X2 [Bradysia coprophila]